MPKTTHQQHDYLHKVGSYSLYGNRRGHVENAPASADEYVPARPLKEQYEVLIKERDALEAVRRGQSLTRDQLQRLNSVKGMIGNIEKTFYDASEQDKAWVFWRIASSRLPHHIFREFDREAVQIMTLAKLAKDSQQ